MTDLNVTEQAEIIEEIDEVEGEQTEETVFSALIDLRTYCAQNLSVSRLLPTKHLNILVEPIRKIEELLNVPPQDAFIKAVVSGKKEFTGFRFPDLALHNNKVCLIYHGKIFDVEAFFAKQAKGKFFCEFDIMNGKLALKILHPDCPDTKYFPIAVYTNEIDKETLDTMKLVRNLSFLKNVLTTYTFPTNYLQDGVYPVIEISERAKQNIVKLEDGNEYFVPEFLAANLKEAKASKASVALVVDGTRTDKNGVEWKNVYAEGYPPSTNLAEYVIKIAKRLGYSVAPNEPFPNPIQFNLIDIKDTKAKGRMPASFVLTLEYDGIKENVRPNTAMKSQKKNGTFKLKSFDGVRLVAENMGVYVADSKDESGNAIKVSYPTVNSYWIIPDDVKQTSKSLEGLEDALRGMI